MAKLDRIITKGSEKMRDELRLLRSQNEDLKEVLEEIISTCKGLESKAFSMAKKALSGQESRNKELINALDEVYNAGYSGISYVGSANYASRVSEAKSNLRNVYEKAINQIKQ